MSRTITRLVNAFAVACYDIDAALDKKFDVVFANLLGSVNNVAQETSITNYKQGVMQTTPANSHRRLFFLPPDIVASIEGNKIVEAFSLDLYFTEAKQMNDIKDDLLRLDDLRNAVMQIIANVDSLSRTPMFQQVEKRFVLNLPTVRVRTELNFGSGDAYCVSVRLEGQTMYNLDCANYLPTTVSPLPIAPKYPTLADIPANIDLTQIKYP